MSSRYITGELVKELNNGFYQLEDHDEYEVDVCCHHRMRRAIEKNAKLNSFRMENPNTEIPFSIPKNRKRHRIKKGIESINAASQWAKANFDPDNLDESFFRGIAKRIFPDMYAGDFAWYRDTGTTISGASVTPPYPYKLQEIEIPKFTEELKSLLKYKEKINGVEAAIYAHLHLVRIHPFVDGNGRTCRVLQDTILDSYGIPVPVIESGERMTYYSLLDSAVYDWKHKGGKERGNVTKGERIFYDYLAGKVNISLEKVIESCNKHNQ
ncbi:MAG: Fic family protein [Candidatus Pacearchaeota archaeon]